MRLLPRVTPHVDHQHVLSLEGLLLPRTLLPAAHELLLLTVDVVVVDVLRGQFIRVNRHNVSQHTSSGDTEVVTRHQVNVCVSTCVCVCVCVLLKTSQQILVFFPPEDSPSFMCPHTHCEWRCHPLWLTVIMHLSTGDKNYKSTVAVVSGCVCLSVCVWVCVLVFSRNRNFFRSQ